MAVENPRRIGSELIYLGFGVVSGLTAIGLEVGARAHVELIHQAPLIRDVSTAVFLVSCLALGVSLLSEFSGLNKVAEAAAREVERDSMRPPTLSKGHNLHS